MHKKDVIKEKVKETIIRAATTYSDKHKEALIKIIQDSNSRNKWIFERMYENAIIAEKNRTPLCDDTGTPYILLEIGKGGCVDYDYIESIKIGVAEGLRELPGRPMAVKGNDIERLEQSCGLFDDPGELAIAPIQIKNVKNRGIMIHIAMQGGGPEIRARTFRIFHQHKISVIIDTIVDWIKDGAGKLGCTPCIPAIGIARTHYEATSLMLESMIKGDVSIQNDIETEITKRVNELGIGPLGLGGHPTALATFLRVGPQRASGARIVSLRLCCLVEPRVASCLL